MIFALGRLKVPAAIARAILAALAVYSLSAHSWSHTALAAEPRRMYAGPRQALTDGQDGYRNSPSRFASSSGPASGWPYKSRRALSQARALVTPTSAPLHLPPPMALPSQPQDQGDNPLTLLAKFAVVLGLLFISLRILRVVMPRRRSAGGAQQSLVLHRETIGDKQTIQWLDLGTHLVLIGVTGTTITPLLTTSDAEEMALIRAQYPGQQPHATTGAWQPTNERPSFARALARAMAINPLPSPQQQRQRATPRRTGRVEPEAPAAPAPVAQVAPSSGIQATLNTMRSLRRRLEQR
ncbi:MAG TPA: flagellar biosynthetic protein FliO [Chloroflexota bacterium]|nr:flagellar biosynthetic protein FliO [Chloroflexota bacterium]HZT96792.1 flagellar biosynthetic protein FliO [Chloroflexota bacterium]